LSACLSGVIYQRLVPRVGGGQMAAFEVLLGTHAVRNLIREGHTRQLRNAITMGRADGMQTLEMNLAWLVSEGYVSREDAVTRSLHPNEIADNPGIGARTASRA
jgi:twitching motility protein PilT